MKLSGPNISPVGTYCQLFPPGQLISWNNFVEGYYTVGKGIVDLCLDGVIELAGNDSHLQVFFGFWFRISVFERLFVDYGHKSKLGTTYYPLVSTAAIKPNNTVRLPHSLLGKSLHFTKFCELNLAVVEHKELVMRNLPSPPAARRKEQNAVATESEQIPGCVTHDV
ncbi:hypothetical protein Bca52824_037655 [Brassica carinata]|uniref:Uncharacterized protein n=1 Tax=Brassica carinata TaxID=52824 RepID=A0A8X7UV99_BRACI|nr:hypothetical protein Bca52824_037655 [Brassica carinata]